MNLTVGSCDNRFLAIGVMKSDNNGTMTAKFNNTTTAQAVKIAGTGNWDNARIFYLANPDVGTHSVAITNTTDDHIALSAMSFCNASSSLSATSSAASKDLVINGLTSGSYLFDAIAQDSFAPGTPSSPQTKLFSLVFDSFEGVGSSYKANTDASTTMGWATGGASSHTGHVGLEILDYTPAATSTGSSTTNPITEQCTTQNQFSGSNLVNSTTTCYRTLDVYLSYLVELVFVGGTLCALIYLSRKTL